MHLPPITRNLLWIMAIVFLLQQFLGNALAPFMLWPLGDYPIGIGSDGLPASIGFQPWQLLSYGFMHGGFGHLFFNCIALFQFGSRLEDVWGPKKYLTFFLVCVVGAGLCQVLFMAFLPQSAGPTINDDAVGIAVERDSNVGTHFGHRVRRAFRGNGRDRHHGWRCAFRAFGRHVVRVAADPLLGRQAAVPEKTQGPVGRLTLAFAEGGEFRADHQPQSLQLVGRL